MKLKIINLVLVLINRVISQLHFLTLIIDKVSVFSSVLVKN